ncbi:hypothetical protein L210DRAFT_3533209 [Boletus edulis BED1]|uniref:Uncharacterized protein n=1 Tax=Boletus edulis BED1 TaxID=1328754 RepID=A0AAD4BZ13_BOLED|nr:hypothetical protein L210DRAFT_3533209 [Boletus edulis BED1]
MHVTFMQLGGNNSMVSWYVAVAHFHFQVTSSCEASSASKDLVNVKQLLDEDLFPRALRNCGIVIIEP